MAPFVAFLKYSNLPSIEKNNEVLMHHVYQKCFWSLDELKKEDVTLG